MNIYEHKTHEQIIDEIFENLKEGYDISLPILNYASFLYMENNEENLTVMDWLGRIKVEVELKNLKEL